MSNKPRMTEVYGDELTALRNSLEIDAPFVIEREGRWYANADELRVWRATFQSSVNDTEVKQ